MKPLPPALALLAAVSSPAIAASPSEGDGVAWDIVADLTTEVGQRLAGTEREAAAREWAVERLEKLGFANVRSEPYTMPAWVRGQEEAVLTAPAPQRLAVTGLGYSGETPAEGIEAELVYFASMAALGAAPAGSLTGKVAFIDHAMAPTQDGSGYGPYGAARRQGPRIAAEKGALAAVIRSIGTDSHRNPHTGAMTYQQGQPQVVGAAVSNPDADLIARIAGQGKPMRVRLLLRSRLVPNSPSGNVVAELPGRDRSLPAILVGCHLDSWDLGTGAIDDAAGCAIVAAAALRAQEGGRPLRTIRVLWAGGEELGGFGAAAYAEAHGAEPHALAMESDFGADRVWRVTFDLAEASKPLADRISAALAPLGIVTGTDKATGGTDVGALIQRQPLGVVDLNQDGTRYFDFHHTPDDTLDKVDPAALEQNVEAWARVLRIVANEPGAIASRGAQ